MTDTADPEHVHEDRLVLSRKQERRLIACKQAREILGSRGFSSAGAVSASEVTSLAGYIITGEME
jgi:hypothetical protein